MPESLRLFVAVTLPEAVRGRLAAAQERLRAAQGDVSWVRVENLHLTLKFLGETDGKRVPRVREALRAVGPGLPPFDAVLAGVGAFGGRAPRVVWAGMAEGAAPLTGLADRVDAALGAVGVAKERRPFAAHATLGRVRSPRNAAALSAAIAAERDASFGAVRVDGFLLMHSQLGPQGSTYSVVERFALGPTA